MRSSRFLTGFLLLQLALPAMAQAAAEAGLYDRMRSLSQQELVQSTNGRTLIDPSIQSFAAAVLSTKEFPLTFADVPKAFDPSQYPSLCSAKDGNRSIEIGQCTLSYAPAIKNLVEQETRVRSLGRDLQVIATSFEAPILDSDYSKFTAQAYSIIRIWRAGTGSVLTTSGSTLRVIPLTRADLQNALAQVQVSLTALDLPPQDITPLGQHSDAYTGAVWRYQYGVRLTSGELAPERTSPVILKANPGSERQALQARIPQLETALQQLWAVAKNRTLVPPLRAGEVVLFTLDDDAKELLPDNVTAWAYREVLPGGKETGDAGLQWNTALDPVLPALCKSSNPDVPCDTGDASKTGTTTLGGEFPPPPVSDDGNGLCAMPYQRRGYLCRPFEAQAGADCEETLAPEKDAVVLGTCTAKEPERASVAGPDACTTLGWKTEDIAFNPDTQCKVSLSCEEIPGNVSAITDPKNADGVIKLRVRESTEGPAAYLFIHELTHVRQLCSLPRNSTWAKDFLQTPITGPNDPLAKDKNEGCCRVEGEAYKAQCEAYAQDGIFGPNGESIGSTSQLPINKETCSQILTDFSCRSRGFGSCAGTFSFTKEDPALQKANVMSAFGGKLKQGLDDIVQLSIDNRPASMPLTCSETYDNVTGEAADARILAGKREAESLGRKVCDPNRSTSYANTIGGNMCVFDSCVEQSFEDHTLIPGQAGVTVQDAAFPNDSCEPLKVDEGSIEYVSQDSLPVLPVYRPERMVQELDTAFCQVNGLPPGALPILCGTKTQRVSGFPTQNPVEQAGRLADQAQDTLEPTQRLEDMSQAIGFRIGSELYDAAITRGVDRLSRVLTDASGLLQEFTTVQFSPNACPTNNANGFLITAPNGKPFCSTPMP